MKLLFILIFILLGGGMFLISILKSVGQMIFGGSARYASGAKKQGQSAGGQRDYSSEASASKKVFARDEGEYVKYEEIKE